MWLAEGALGQASRGSQIQRAGCSLSVPCHSQEKSAAQHRSVGYSQHCPSSSPGTGEAQAEAGWLLARALLQLLLRKLIK